MNPTRRRIGVGERRHLFALKLEALILNVDSPALNREPFSVCI
jgi:hypothetical protein